MYSAFQPINHPPSHEVSTTLTVGRFCLALDLDRKPLGGLTWRITNPETIRASEDFPASGIIRSSPFALDEVFCLASNLTRYEHFLATEELIASDPEKYAALGEQAVEAEDQAAAEAQAAAEKLAAEQEEAAEQRRGEIEAQQAAELEEARRLGLEQAAANHKARVEQRIREAAARELTAS